MRKIVPEDVVPRKALLAAIRTAVDNAGGVYITIQNFLDGSGMRRVDIYRLFPTWADALAAAGFHFERYNQKADNDALLADWGAVARKLKRPPPALRYRSLGKYAQATFQLRFGSWDNVRLAFRAFADGKPQWADVLAFCPEFLRDRSAAPSAKNGSLAPCDFSAIATPRDDRTTYGDPLLLPGLRNAPTNESGVVLAFGILAARLGFHIQSVQTAFPDCEALRRVGLTKWQTVKIEFEYESANFLHHQHPPEGCDIIVCWIHNWKDCPANLEVIALSEKLDLLRGYDGEREAQGSARVPRAVSGVSPETPPTTS